MIEKNGVVVFIPMFNEEEVLPATLSAIPRNILRHEVTVVVVDDGSTDMSASIAVEFTQHVVRLERNSGVGVATKKGLEYVVNMGIDFAYLIKLDADGQHDLGFMPQIIRKLYDNDVVICSRFHPLSKHAHTPIDRILLNSIFANMVGKITQWRLTDARSGYMGFRFELIKRIASTLSVERYGIPMEILLRIWGVKKDAKVCEIPHPALYKDVSGRLDQKYLLESMSQKAARVQDAYCALLQVIDEMNVPRDYILKINGYKNY